MTTMMSLDPQKIKTCNDINPRTTNGSYKDLVASIKAYGILEAPAVRKVNGHYQIVYGNRRVAAAKSLKLQSIDCQVIDVDDNEAREMAISENMVRVRMHPMDEYEAFQKMADNGLSIKEIACRFATTEKWVTQRLKLGSLHPKVRKAYRKDEINLDACMAYTLLPAQEQAELLKSGVTDSWGIRKTITADSISSKNVAFNLKKYKGPKTEDLFGDDVFLTDIAECISLTDEHVEQRLTALRKEYAFAYSVKVNDFYNHIYTIDGIKYERSYSSQVWDYEECKYVGQDMSAKEKKKFGVLILMGPHCRVQEEIGWTVKTVSKREIKDKKEDSKPTETKKQSTMLRQVASNAWNKFANVDDAIKFWAMKRPMSDSKNKENCEKSFIAGMGWEQDRDNFDADVLTIAKDRKWNLRSVWTPDEEFLSKYPTHVLRKIKAEICAKAPDFKTKGEELAYVVKAFADGKGKDWLPNVLRKSR